MVVILRSEVRGGSAPQSSGAARSIAGDPTNPIPNRRLARQRARAFSADQPFRQKIGGALPDRILRAPQSCPRADTQVDSDRVY